MFAFNSVYRGNNSVVMDGRDIGIDVLPDAQIKIFLTASVTQRAIRRYNEQKEKGILEKALLKLRRRLR